MTWYYKNKRRDPDNIAAGGTKFLFDSLVKNEIIKDDTLEFISGFTHYFVVGEKDGVEIEIV
jgi:Holliday junction resolvase RusA-like endonuclease